VPHESRWVSGRGGIEAPMSIILNLFWNSKLSIGGTDRVTVELSPSPQTHAGTVNTVPAFCVCERWAESKDGGREASRVSETVAESGSRVLRLLVFLNSKRLSNS